MTARLAHAFFIGLVISLSGCVSRIQVSSEPLIALVEGQRRGRFALDRSWSGMLTMVSPASSPLAISTVTKARLVNVDAISVSANRTWIGRRIVDCGSEGVSCDYLWRESLPNAHEILTTATYAALKSKLGDPTNPTLGGWSSGTRDYSGEHWNYFEIKSEQVIAVQRTTVSLVRNSGDTEWLIERIEIAEGTLSKSPAAEIPESHGR